MANVSSIYQSVSFKIETEYMGHVYASTSTLCMSLSDGHAMSMMLLMPANYTCEHEDMDRPISKQCRCIHDNDDYGHNNVLGSYIQ